MTKSAVTLSTPLPHRLMPQPALTAPSSATTNVAAALLPPAKSFWTTAWNNISLSSSATTRPVEAGIIPTISDTVTVRSAGGSTGGSARSISPPPARSTVTPPSPVLNATSSSRTSKPWSQTKAKETISGTSASEKSHATSCHPSTVTGSYSRRLQRSPSPLIHTVGYGSLSPTTLFPVDVK